jgi:hypothetical protein
MQSRLMSLLEAVTNIVVGYALAVLTQIMVFPLFGLHASLGENLLIGSIFTLVSLFRSYTLRRVFNAFGGWWNLTHHVQLPGRSKALAGTRESGHEDPAPRS